MTREISKSDDSCISDTEISDWTEAPVSGAELSPPWSRRGVRAINQMFRRHLLLARTGWLVQQPLISLTSTTPSAPSTVASQHSIDGAASPPRLRRGILLRFQDFPASQAN